jgi:beta-glucosidase
MRTNAGGADEAPPAMGGPARTAAWPQNFLWGVATAGYQVEGGITNNDWNIFTTSPSIVSRVHNIGLLAGEGIDLIPPGEAVRQGDLATLREDLDRAALLGLNAYRFSVEWSRVEPTLGSNSIALEDYYVPLVQELRQRGMTPVVTLSHLTLLSWVLTPPVNYLYGLTE